MAVFHVNVGRAFPLRYSGTPPRVPEENLWH